MNSIEELYNFSKNYAPPNFDLKNAEIASEWGNSKLEDREIDHSDPEKVTRYEIEFYTMIYAFLDFKDFLFYLYPMCREFEKDAEFENFFFSWNLLTISSAKI